jgi:beta-glucanase (GH16 family)
MGDRAAGEFPGYSLAWSDEFDGAAGAAPDPRSWWAETGGHGWGNRELQYYTADPGNAALDGAGNLAIVVRRPDPRLAARRYGGSGYTSARLVTKGRVSLRYGLVRARIKIPFSRGIWPAFWMLGQDFDQAGWPGCGEIDVMEHFGTGPATVHGAVHGPGYCGARGVTGSREVGPSLGSEFHVYSVCWEPGRIRWFADDAPYHAVTPAQLRGRSWVFDHDFFLLLNVAVGGTASRTPDSSVTFPQTMLVDYVRVYAPATTPSRARAVRTASDSVSRS